MTDEKTNEGNTSGEGTNPIPKENEIDSVKNNLAQLRAANDEVEKEMLRAEELRAKMQLGGKAEAGQSAPKPKEETDKEYAEKVISGEFNEKS